MPTRREFINETAAATLIAAGASRLTAAPSGSYVRKRPKEPLRLAIVGTGQISHRYLSQAAKGNRARFVATCARTLDSAKARAVEYGIPAWFDDYEKMYDAVKPDGVIIVTPSAVHAAPAIAAFKRGIHILCEKPMATSYEDCQAMVAAAERSGAVFLNMPFDATPAFVKALAYLNADTLGVFTGAEAQLLIPGHDRDNWYYDRNVAGGVMLDTMVYPVSRLVSFLGPARRVTGFVNTLIPHRLVGGKTVESTIDDNVTLILEWEHGQQAILRALWGTAIARLNTVIYGRQGTLWAGPLEGNAIIVQSNTRKIEGATEIEHEGQKALRVPVDTTNLATEGIIEHFADCIAGIAQPTCGGRQQLHVHEILFKGYEAARTGTTQALVTTFESWHPIAPDFLDTRSKPL